MTGKGSSRAGRKPKPDLKVVPGGPVEASVPVQIDEPPEGLPLAGREFWEVLAPELESVGLLTPLTMPAFYMTCLSWGIACDAAAVLAKEGYTVQGQRGQTKKHPALTLLNEQMTQFRQYLSEFGLSPAALKRLGGHFQKSEHDRMTELLHG